MKQIRLENEPGRKNPLVTIWERLYINDTSKFISATYLKCEDLGREFEDENGEKWKILGMMEGKDLPCEKVSTGEIFIWDRWKVSERVYPENHAPAKNVEYFYPKPVKASRAKKVPPTQLDMFNEN